MKETFDYNLSSWELYFKKLLSALQNKKEQQLRESMVNQPNEEETELDKEAYEEKLLIDFERELLGGFEIKEFPGAEGDESEDRATQEYAGIYFIHVYYRLMYCVCKVFGEGFN